MKTTEKKKAIKLRQAGWSIGNISNALGVSKGSVSAWVHDIVLTKNQTGLLNRQMHAPDVVEKRRRSRINNECVKRDAIIEHAGKDISDISDEGLKLIGSALYWAEGRKKGKRMITFSNSDPALIKIMMRFLKEICGVPQRRFRGHIHTHSHLNTEAAENYWSTTSGIPRNQFFKTYSKPSKAGKGKADPLPFGTLDIYVADVSVYLKVMGWIRKISTILLK